MKKNAYLRMTVFVKSVVHLFVADHVTSGSVFLTGGGCDLGGCRQSCRATSLWLEPPASVKELNLGDCQK